MFPFNLDVFKVSLAASVISVLVTLSFPQYFFFVPFANGVNVMSTLGFLSSVGLIAMIVLPPIFLLDVDQWSRTKNVYFLIAVTTWTLTTVAIKIYTLATLGRIWADYLVLYPVLFFIEWLLPIFYVILAFKLRSSQKPVANADQMQTRASQRRQSFQEDQAVTSSGL